MNIFEVIDEQLPGATNASVTCEWKRGRKSFEIEIRQDGDDFFAEIRDMDSDTKIPVTTRRKPTLEDLFLEIKIHLTDVKP